MGYFAFSAYQCQLCNLKPVTERVCSFLHGIAAVTKECMSRENGSIQSSACDFVIIGHVSGHPIMMGGREMNKRREGPHTCIDTDTRPCPAARPLKIRGTYAKAFPHKMSQVAGLMGKLMVLHKSHSTLVLFS